MNGRPGRFYALIAGGLLIALAVLLIATGDPWLSWSGDSAMYLMHARNLVEGAAYNATGYIQNPNAYLAPQAYPPGFPLVLVPVYALTGLHIGALKIYATLLFVLAIGAFAGLVRRDLGAMHLGNWAWLGLMPLIGANPLLSGYACSLYSDGFFLLTVYAALWATEAVYRRYAAQAPTLVLAILAGGLIGFCAITRVFGLLLFVSIVLFELLRYQRPTPAGLQVLVSGMAVYAIATAAIARDSIAIDSGSHQGYGHLLTTDLLTHATQLPATIFNNIVAYIEYSSRYLILELPWGAPARLTNFSLAITLAVLLLGLVGYIACVRRRLTVRDLFCVIYLLGLLPWMATNARYLMPVIPLLFFYVVVGIHALARRPGLFTAVLGILLVICAGTYTGRYIRYAHTDLGQDLRAANSQPAEALYDYIRRHTDRDAVFVFSRPRVLALFTQRSAVTYRDAMNPMPPDPQMFDLMDRTQASYLLDAGLADHTQVAALVARHPERLRLVYRSGPFRLYRRLDTTGS
ncbi:hypothetical protein V5738_05875 [Salinisphaera sp. SPP-AMP-43]|uniref:hypothetical protein n=1 Tax=Salinisphaera sp. SPP-AMP-43 TaxID=3121288 RepID=UPI003C6E72A3